jgi:hypothetical protein
MNQTLAVISIVVGAFGLAALVGTVLVAFTRASFAKATIEALRGDVEDRDKRIDFLEEENVRTKAALKRIGEENRVLKANIGNKEEIRQLLAQSDAHERAAELRHHDTVAMVEKALIAIEEHHEDKDKAS